MQEAALITGASDRTGKAIAEYFARQGLAIAIHYNHSAAKANETAAYISKTYQVSCRTFQADFSNTEETEKLIPQIAAYYKLQVVVNNASLFRQSNFTASSAKTLQQFMAPNLQAPYILTQAFAHAKPTQGLVINILDTDISKQDTAYFDYLLTKKFLKVFTEMAAYHLAPQLRVNGIAPGYMLVPNEGGQINELDGNKHLQELASQSPLKAQNELNDIIRAVDYLYHQPRVTGQILFADSGMHLK